VDRFEPIRVDLLPEANALRFVIGRGEPGAAIPVAATIDIGERGALLGVELRPDPSLVAAWPALREAAGPDGAFYLPIAPDLSGPHDRSVPVTVELRPDADGAPAAVDLPRRGAGYEISYPSGNQ
jgi:hypothetical protein